MTEFSREQELNPGQQLEWCLSNLGERLTTGIFSPELGVRVLEGWLIGDVPEAAIPRVTLLYEAAKEVSGIYDEETARALLRGSNPYAGDGSLLRVIAQAEPEEAQAIVSGAVRAFLD